MSPDHPNQFTLPRQVAKQMAIHNSDGQRDASARQPVDLLCMRNIGAYQTDAHNNCIFQANAASGWQQTG
jgi:hypothetical protein